MQFRAVRWVLTESYIPRLEPDALARRKLAPRLSTESTKSTSSTLFLSRVQRHSILAIQEKTGVVAHLYSANESLGEKFHEP